MNLQIIFLCPGDLNKQKHLFLALTLGSGDSLPMGVPTSSLAPTIYSFSRQTLE